MNSLGDVISTVPHNFLLSFQDFLVIAVSGGRSPVLLIAAFSHLIGIKMPLFGKSQKSPAEVVKALKEAVTSLEKGDKKLEKVNIVASLLLSLYKLLISFIISGTGRCQQKFGPDKKHALRDIRQ